MFHKLGNVQIWSFVIKSELKVLNVSSSDLIGGAARAAYRIHKSFSTVGIKSTLLVCKKASEDPSVFIRESLFGGISLRFRSRISAFLNGQLDTPSHSFRSPALISSGLVRYINKSDASIVNLHWVQGEMLSIGDIAGIRKPVVWTLHDMWAFCGAEHYTDDDRWRVGYHPGNRPTGERGFDLNLWAWAKKQRLWKRPIHLVCPSPWLAWCAKESALLSSWPVSTIAYPIDLETWRPIPKETAREALGLPFHSKIVLFGSVDGGRDPRKGLDLLYAALDSLSGREAGILLVIFGEERSGSGQRFGSPVRFMGTLRDDLTLRLLYSAADLFALPSRQDNFPLTCMESLACGTPVVAFDTSGPSSMIDHKVTGYLATPFEPRDFAFGMSFVLRQSTGIGMRIAARRYAEQEFSPASVASRYQDVYQDILKV